VGTRPPRPAHTHSPTHIHSSTSTHTPTFTHPTHPTHTHASRSRGWLTPRD
jgi:hypothetical protein